MENKETKSDEMLIIKAVVEKESKQGRKYHSVETDRGNYSCFEYDLVAELKKCIGKKVDVETASNDRGFKNIRKLLSVIEVDKVGTKESSESVGTNNFTEAKQAKDQSIYTSYAKDIFIELLHNKPEGGTLEEVMKLSINLVKQAKDAFNDCKEAKK